jgi:uncharacterized membrane protein
LILGRMQSKFYDILFSPACRILTAISIGILVYSLPARGVRFEIRLLLAWDVGVLYILGIILTMMKLTDAKQTLKRAQKQEPSNVMTLTVTVVTCVASMVAVAFMLNDGQTWKMVPANVHLGLCTVAIFSSWFLLHTIFALHYARLYYDEFDEPMREGYKKGLEFPGGKLVDYWDFMYYSFTIAMCYQTSDVSISTPSMRRITLVHAIISFIFVAMVIGLVVNVVSNLA